MLKKILISFMIIGTSLMAISVDKELDEICKDKIPCTQKGLELQELGNKIDSLKYYKRSCEMGLGLGCSQEAVYLSKIGSSSNKQAVLDKYSEGCDKGDRLGCAYAGESYLKDTFYDKALPLLTKACSLNDYRSCTKLGVMYLKSYGVKSDILKANILLTKSCKEGNDKDACSLVSILNKAEFNFFTKKCNSNNAEACAYLGSSYIKGIGVEKNTLKGIQYLRKSCDLGLKTACDVYDSIKKESSK